MDLSLFGADTRRQPSRLKESHHGASRDSIGQQLSGNPICLVSHNVTAKQHLSPVIMSHPQTDFGLTTFTGPSLLSSRRGTVSHTTLFTQLERIKETGRYDCFKLQWHPIYEDKSLWPVPLHLFWDSDIAKWIEGACYFLQECYDARIDAAVQELVGMIRSAQQEDGFLNIHYTVVEPKKRWSNLRDMHEL